MGGSTGWIAPSLGPTTDNGVLLGTSEEKGVNIDLTFMNIYIYICVCVYRSSIQTKSSQKSSTLLPPFFV